MVLFSIHLPAKYRLSINLAKRRKNLDDPPLLPDLGKVSRARGGYKLSRFFRLFFENEKIKKAIGTNLVLLFVASSILPRSVTGSEPSEVNSISSPVVLTTEQGTQFPVEKINISQGYRFYHPGIDLDGITGDSIYPIMAGVVSKIEYSRFGYGKSVIISHGGESKSLYAHLSKIEVSEGQVVTKETKLGEMGATGQAFGDHLHIEVYEDGHTINPLSILPKYK